MIPEHLKEKWFIYRLALERVADLSTMERHWTLDQIMAMNELLDAKEEAEQRR